jgi:hypothetical protein
MDKTIVWSYGGGTQSIALALLISQGKLPKPDMIVLADTGREASETFEYTERYVAPLLATLGLTIEIASHDLSKVDLYNKTGKKETLLIPAYTQDGKLSNFCSHEWKLRVVRRYIRAKGVERCINWLGMSTDEVERLHPSDVQWCETHWPLCDMPVSAKYGVSMSRAMCKQLILEHGWPEPPKSSCWMCPHRRNKQWQRLKMFYPQDFERAVQLDKEVRAKDTKGGVWLHESRKPLDEVDFSQDDQPGLFGCDSGFCWT